MIARQVSSGHVSASAIGKCAPYHPLNASEHAFNLQTAGVRLCVAVWCSVGETEKTKTAKEVSELVETIECRVQRCRSKKGSEER